MVTASGASFDCIVAGGRVIDARHGTDARMDVGVRDGRIAAVAPELPASPGTKVIDARSAIVLPGLIDLHTHVYHRATSYGVDPDLVASRSLVATMVDAGSAGAGNVDGLAEFVMQRTRTRLFAFLNISFPGIFAFDSRVMMGEAAHPSLLDVPRCVEAAQRHADRIVGIKLRLGGAVSGEVGLEALDAAIHAAEALELPVMCHVGRPPPGYAEILDRLRPGDILTHCFRPPPNAPVDAERRLLPALRSARQRGVLFDIGHGMGAFAFDSAEAALGDGFAPDIVSSDVHALSVAGPAFDLLHVMNKLLNCGIGVADLARMVTEAPARAMQRTELGHLGPGAPADLAVLELREAPVRFVDAAGVTRDGTLLLKPRGMLREGNWCEAQPRPWELPREVKSA